MKRAELEHIIWASAAICGDDEIVVVGSQSILGKHPAAPAELCVSNEADVYPRNHPERADLIEGSIGELSPFHTTFGYYAQAVSPETSKCPQGWEQRLIAVRNENTRQATGWCLEPHDLALAKYVAAREKDLDFNASAIRHGLLARDTLETRLAAMDVDEPTRARIPQRIALDFKA